MRRRPASSSRKKSFVVSGSNPHKRPHSLHHHQHYYQYNNSANNNNQPPFPSQSKPASGPEAARGLEHQLVTSSASSLSLERLEKERQGSTCVGLRDFSSRPSVVVPPAAPPPPAMPLLTPMATPVGAILSMPGGRKLNGVASLPR